MIVIMMIDDDGVYIIDDEFFDDDDFDALMIMMVLWCSQPYTTEDLSLSPITSTNDFFKSEQWNILRLEAKNVNKNNNADMT